MRAQTGRCRATAWAAAALRTDAKPLLERLSAVGQAIHARATGIQTGRVVRAKMPQCNQHNVLGSVGVWLMGANRFG